MTVLALLQREVIRTLQHLPSSTFSKSQARVLSRNESSFVPKRVLVLAKVSRYHYERLRESDLAESELRNRLIERGSDYDALLASHHANKRTEDVTTKILRDLKIECRVMNRLSIDHEAFDWADLILPIGGDGTYLFSANMIYNNEKPIIGINSDPSTSEGHLMLPEIYTKDIRSIFERLRAGDYKVLMRSRIRTTLKGQGIWRTPFHVHEKWRCSGDERYKVNDSDNDASNKKNDILGFHIEESCSDTDSENLPKERRLPWLALNEVFIGECLSARTSTLDINVGDEVSFRIKSSGLCASTGTGSTSWHKAINNLSPQTVEQIFRLGNVQLDSSRDPDRIAAEFNERLQFPADDKTIAYTIRDMVVGETFPLPKGIEPRGRCNRLVVRSHCFDAGLVLDGGIAVPFNDGTVAVMETHPEDALRSIVFD